MATGTVPTVAETVEISNVHSSLDIVGKTIVKIGSVCFISFIANVTGTIAANTTLFKLPFLANGRGDCFGTNASGTQILANIPNKNNSFNTNSSWSGTVWINGFFFVE